MTTTPTAQHTPGPWQVISGNVYDAESKPAPFTDTDGVHHPDSRSGLIALVYQDHEGRANGANARLIAAAPEMLALLRAIHEVRSDDNPLYEACERIAPLLAKIEGGA